MLKDLRLALAATGATRSRPLGLGSQALVGTRQLTDRGESHRIELVVSQALQLFSISVMVRFGFLGIFFGPLPRLGVSEEVLRIFGFCAFALVFNPDA